MKKTFKYIIEVTGDIQSEANNFCITPVNETAHKLDNMFEELVLEDISNKIMSDILQTEAQELRSNIDSTVTFVPVEIKINKQ